MVTLALLPFIPDAAEKLLDALGEEDRGLAEFGSRGGGREHSADRRAVPEARGGGQAGVNPAAPRLPRVVDTHAHIGLCEGDPAAIVARAAAGRGRGGSSPWASTRRRTSEAVALAREHDAVFACVGRHPELGGGLRRRGRGGRCVSSRRTTPWPRWARRGSTSTATGRPARRPAPRVSRADRDRPPGRQAAGDPHALGRGARGRCGVRDAVGPRGRRPRGSTVILHCFSAPSRAGGGGRGERLVLLVRRQRDLSEGGGAARGGAARAGRADPGRDRLAVPGAAVAAGQAERAGARRRDGARGGGGAGDGVRRVRGAGGGERRGGCSSGEAWPELPGGHEPARRDRPRGRAFAGRRRARGRRRGGRLDRAARVRRRDGARGRARRAVAPGLGGVSRRGERGTSGWSFGDAMDVDLGGARPGAERDGLEPSVLDRDAAPAAHDRRAAEPRALDGDGAARDRRPACAPRRGRRRTARRA